MARLTNRLTYGAIIHIRDLCSKCWIHFVTLAFSERVWWRSKQSRFRLHNFIFVKKVWSAWTWTKYFLYGKKILFVRFPWTRRYATAQHVSTYSLSIRVMMNCDLLNWHQFCYHSSRNLNRPCADGYSLRCDITCQNLFVIGWQVFYYLTQKKKIPLYT